MPSAPLDPEEATLSPTWAPAVLDDPEVATALRAVADGCNRMVVFLPVPKKPFQSKISTYFFTRNVPAIRVSRLLAAARVLEDAVAVVEQVVSLQEKQYYLKEANSKARYCNTKILKY